MTEFPRAIRGLPPHDDDFQKIIAFNGKLLEGAHTGGVWYLPSENEVWKPLDGGNAHDGPHYPTLEAECLEEMAGEVGFPRNWIVQSSPVEVDGEIYERNWIVRKKALVWGQDKRLRGDGGLAYFVENAVRALNSRGWEVGDSISLAFDLDLYEWFILDLSCARRTYATASAWDDEWRVEAWWKENGYTRLLNLRQAGRHQVSGLEAIDNGVPRGWRVVYASRNRPVSFTWASRLRDRAVLLPGDYSKDRVHTWIVTEAPLDDKTVRAYELDLAWWPWDTPARRKE